MATSALITGTKTYPFIDIRPDIKSMIRLCESNSFKIHNVLVNTEDLSNHPRRKVYSTKDEYRKTFIDFLAKSPEEFLIYFYCGHGAHQWNSAMRNNEECLCIAEDHKEWYIDAELTEDIDEYLPAGKTLYVVIDSCHSGGMMNLWHLDTRLEKTVVFFCGANAEIFAWDDMSEGATGGLFTNTFCKHATVGRPIWEIADNVLLAMFKPDKKDAYSPSVRYSRPSVAVKKFCQA